MKPLSELSAGKDFPDGLERVLKIWSFFVDAKNEKINVIFDIETLSPNGTVVYTQEQSYERYNKPAVMDGEKEIVPANMAFNKLRDSDVGVAICAMLLADLKLYPNLQQS